jgi:hypothetical protein
MASFSQFASKISVFGEFLVNFGSKTIDLRFAGRIFTCKTMDFGQF